MKYISTRGNSKIYSFSQTILKGIADDGGLFVPTEIPRITSQTLYSWLTKDYKNLAFEVFKLFIDDFTDVEVKEIINKAYSNNFDTKEVTKLINLKNKTQNPEPETQNIFINELWHGPTAAFKDLALQIMPRFFEKAVEKEGSKNKFLILVATSGDTGSAALEGFKNIKNTSIIAYFPYKNVSEVQEKQMTTIDGNNTFSIASKGNFDDIQTAIKNIFTDKKFNQDLKENYNTTLSSANSINWGRLVPQIVYHIKSYLDLVNLGTITLGEEIDILVPSANFGNLLAGYYAKSMGIPFKRLISASNDNNILEEFFNTGKYDISHKQLINTPSPSMDIILSSNIERLLYHITNDSNEVGRLMSSLKDEKSYQLHQKDFTKLQSIFSAYSLNAQDSLETVSHVFQKYKYLIDTHTAVGFGSAQKYLKDNNTKRPLIISSTAHWSKFGRDIYKSIISETKDTSDEFSIISKLSEYTKSDIHPKINQLKNKAITQKNVIENGEVEIKNSILEILKNY